MFFKKKISKFIFFYLCSNLIIGLLPFITDIQLFQIFKIEEIGNPDLEWNDLHYKRVDIDNDPIYTRDKSVVLINTGKLDSDSFRLELARVLFKVKQFNPKAIGIDLHFDTIEKIGTNELKKEVNNYTRIVVALDSNNYKSKISFHAKKGYVDFPDSDLGSIRRYYTNTSTFGYQLAKVAYPKSIFGYLDKNKEFTIHYTTLGDGISDCDSFEENVNFKVIDAKKLLDPHTEIEFYKDLIKNKIIVFGHTGEILNDSEDKHRVPCDTSQFILRDRKMYGAVIHANAIENILHPSSRFIELNSFENTILEQVLFITFLLILLCEFGRFINILVLVILSIFYLILIIKIMEYNIYIKVSNTLLYLLCIEEFYEFIEPLYIKSINRLKFDQYEKK